MGADVAGGLLVIAIAAGLVLWVGLRRGRGAGSGGGAAARDALSYACRGDEEQAQRLERLEHEQAARPISRAEARRRAAGRLRRDRS